MSPIDRRPPCPFTNTGPSKAAEALRTEYEHEIRERDERLSALSDGLERAEAAVAEQREQLARAREELGNAAIFASQATAVLQQIR